LLVLPACDTMISDKIRIAPPSITGDAVSPFETVLTLVRVTLSSCGLERVESAGIETWQWRDPDRPPGLHATIESAGGGAIRVRLSQDLYGPIGPTEKYRSVKKALVDAAGQRFGRASIQVE
jgi:hypothetical protein